MLGYKCNNLLYISQILTRFHLNQFFFFLFNSDDKQHIIFFIPKMTAEGLLSIHSEEGEGF